MGDTFLALPEEIGADFSDIFVKYGPETVRKIVLTAKKIERNLDPVTDVEEIVAPKTTANCATEKFECKPTAKEVCEVINLKAPYDNADLLLRECYSQDDGSKTLVLFQENFFLFVGTHWEKALVEYIRRQIYEWLSSKWQKVRKSNGTVCDMPVKPNRSIVDSLLDAVRARALLNVKTCPCWLGEEIAPQDEIVCCQNGLLHVPTRKLLPHTPKFFNTNCIGYRFEPQAPVPEAWLKFLDEILEGDEEAKSALQEFSGLALTPITRFQKGLMIVGPPRSGKGTIAKVQTDLVGRENVCSPTLAGLSQNFGLASMIDKRLAIISDARVSGKVDGATVTENLLRAIGEDSISVHRKFLTNVETILHAKFLVLTNETVALGDASTALPSRFILVQLRKSFLGKEDLRLADKLLKELPGILNWALAGLDKLLSRGHFVQPRSALETVEAFRVLSSPVTAFVEDRCILAKGSFTSCEDIHGAWVSWCETQGRDHPGNVQSFGEKLKAAFPQIKSSRPHHSGRRVRGYEGIRVRVCTDLDFGEGV